MKKRLGIIYHPSIHDERCGFVEQSRNLYDEILLISPERVVYEYKRESTVPSMRMGDISLNNLSMVYFLEYHGCTAQQVLLLLSNLQKEGCPLSTNIARFANCYSGVTNNFGKCHELLQTKINNSRTNSYIIHNKSLVEDTLTIAQKHGHFPLVYKPVNGFGGVGVVKLAGVRQAKEYIVDCFANGIQIVLLEQFVEFEKEWRVYIADSEIVCAYEKVGAPKEFVRNLVRGGSMKPIDSDFKFVRKYIAKFLPTDCQLGLYGIDVARRADGEMHLIEINTIFLYRNVLEITEVDLPCQAAKILYRRARL